MQGPFCWQVRPACGRGRDCYACASTRTARRASLRFQPELVGCPADMDEGWASGAGTRDSQARLSGWGGAGPGSGWEHRSRRATGIGRRWIETIGLSAGPPSSGLVGCSRAPPRGGGSPAGLLHRRGRGDRFAAVSRPGNSATVVCSCCSRRGGSRSICDGRRISLCDEGNPAWPVAAAWVTSLSEYDRCCPGWLGAGLGGHGHPARRPPDHTQERGRRSGRCRRVRRACWHRICCPGSRRLSQSRHTATRQQRRVLWQETSGETLPDEAATVALGGRLARRRPTSCHGLLCTVPSGRPAKPP